MNQRTWGDPGGKDVATAGQTGEQTGSRDFAAPLGSATSGRLIFVSGASSVTVHADPAMADFYSARFKGHVPNVWVRDDTVTVRYPRFPPFDWLHYRRDLGGTVALNTSIPWRIDVRDGASRLTADLRELRLDSLNLSGGASRVAVTLPKPWGTTSVRILGGASNVTIHRPARAAARLHMGGGATNLTFDEEHFGAIGGEVGLQTPDYDGASARYDIAITGGANIVTVGVY